MPKGGGRRRNVYRYTKKRKQKRKNRYMPKNCRNRSELSDRYDEDQVCLANQGRLTDEDS